MPQRTGKEEKSVLRKRILSIRNGLPSELQHQAAEAMCAMLLKHPFFLDSGKVLAYVSYGSELGTHVFLQEALTRGKQLFLPKISGDEMIFLRIHSMDELSPGYKGIPEPVSEQEKYIYQPGDAAGEMLLMPGVGFDAEGHRMGYGKGFYDRFLADKPILAERSIAVCHKCQMVERVPFDEFDVKPKQIFAF